MLSVISVTSAFIFFALLRGSSSQEAPFTSLFRRSFFKSSVDVDPNLVCFGCTIFVNFIDEVAIYREISIAEALEYVCKILPEKEQKTCDAFVFAFGKIIIELLEKMYTPDEVCMSSLISLCHDPRCILFKKEDYLHKRTDPDSQYKFPTTSGKRNKENEAPATGRRKVKIDPYPPLIDDDKDLFSTIFGLRGSGWRGKDCDDSRADIYPGRKTHPDKDIDFNCNGIQGKSKEGEYYNEKFCQESRGIAVLGDSVAAHFHFPVEFLSPSANESTYFYLPEVGEMELDWPFLGSVTGYMNDFTGLAHGNVSSIYKVMNERNKCNHRDYQNIGVNGARSYTLKNLASSLHRDQENDYPMTVLVILCGDDVCYPEKWRYTDPEKYYNGLKDGLEYLDTILPNNSYVLVFGLVDGRLLYDVMADEIHPIGKGVTYKEAYTYLNCLNISMCWGWMNENETIRNYTTDWSEKLNEQARKLVKTESYEHFKAAWMFFDQEGVINRMIEHGFKKKDAIEPFDGFHPTQWANYYAVDLLVDEVESTFPDALGEKNKWNSEIERLFGDQGGY